MMFIVKTNETKCNKYIFFYYVYYHNINVKFNKISSAEIGKKSYFYRYVFFLKSHYPQIRVLVYVIICVKNHLDFFETYKITPVQIYMSV